MNKFIIDELNPRDELVALLDFNAMRYREEPGGAIHALFAQEGYKWEVVFRFARRAVLVYGIYPFQAAEGVGAALGGINARLVHGAVFVHEGAVVMRTSAELFDAYSAYEAIALAIEYNAGAVVAFWTEVSRISANAE